jgi:hypothetical protein
MKKFLCKLFGHSWRITYIYGASAHAKCKRCGETRHDLIGEFLK